MWIINNVDSDIITDDIVRNLISYLNKKLDEPMYEKERLMIEASIKYYNDILIYPLTRKLRGGKV